MSVISISIVLHALVDQSWTEVNINESNTRGDI